MEFSCGQAGGQAMPDLQMALMRVSSFRMQAGSATLDGLPAAFRHRQTARMAGSWRTAPNAAMYGTVRTSARPPRQVRLPRIAPLSRGSAAAPAGLPMPRRPACPNPGSMRIRTACADWPIPLKPLGKFRLSLKCLSGLRPIPASGTLISLSGTLMMVWMLLACSRCAGCRRLRPAVRACTTCARRATSAPARPAPARGGGQTQQQLPAPPAGMQGAGKVRQHARIQVPAPGRMPHGFAKVVCLTRIDHDGRQGRQTQMLRRHPPKTARGLHPHHRHIAALKARLQGGNARSVMTGLPGLTPVIQGHFQRCPGHVHASKPRVPVLRNLRHDPALQIRGPCHAHCRLADTRSGLRQRNAARARCFGAGYCVPKSCAGCGQHPETVPGQTWSEGYKGMAQPCGCAQRL